MKMLRQSALILLSVILASAALPARADADDAALLARMSGNYRDNTVVYRSQITGNPDIYTPGTMTLRMPKGRGKIVGNISAVGDSYRVTGQATRARVVGRTVRYTGNLRIAVLGGYLTQRNFRATASPKGPNGEVLAAVVRLSFTLGGNSISLSNVFRGTK